jgi:hypothetical protein
MMTYAEARALAISHLMPGWDNGELATAEAGWEDAEFFVVPYGNARYIRGGDLAFAVPDDAVLLVDKANGDVFVRSRYEVANRLEGMTAVTA